MDPRTTWPALLALVLLAGCSKDGMEPPLSGSERLIGVRFDPHCDGLPYHPDSLYSDWTGTRLRFDDLRLVLVGACLRGDQGLVLLDRPDDILTFDLAAEDPPVQYLDPGLSAMDDVHWLDTRTLSLADSTGPAAGHGWTGCGAVTCQAVLDLRGVIDGNGDGVLDGSDTPFRVLVRAGEEPTALRIHAHAIAPVERELTIAVNITALVNGLDLVDQPMNVVESPQTALVLQNLRTIVLGADNKPL